MCTPKFPRGAFCPCLLATLRVRRELICALVGRRGHIVTKWMAEITQNCYDGAPSQHGRLRAIAFWGLAEYVRIMEDAAVRGQFLLPEEARSLHEAAFASLRALKALAVESFAGGEAMWAIKPKHHQMDHIASSATQGCQQFGGNRELQSSQAFECGGFHKPVARASSRACERKVPS
eukprot:765192-Alexandrium_andersonii.AAC.2